jgi:hypothetical protein
VVHPPLQSHLKSLWKNNSKQKISLLQLLMPAVNAGGGIGRAGMHGIEADKFFAR